MGHFSSISVINDRCNDRVPKWPLLKQAWHGAEREKTIQSVNVADVNELNDVSSDEDTSQRSQQTGSTYGSSISSQASNPTDV